jgi:hypothetical protein
MDIIMSSTKTTHTLDLKPKCGISQRANSRAIIMVNVSFHLCKPLSAEQEAGKQLFF